MLPKKPLENILGGTKKVETIFTKENRPPYNCVKVDDTIYIRVSGGYAIAKAKATKVENFENLTPDKVIQLLEAYKTEISPTKDMYETKIYSKYASFVWLDDVQEIPPFSVDNRYSNNYLLSVDSIEKIRRKM